MTLRCLSLLREAMSVMIPHMVREAADSQRQTIGR